MDVSILSDRADDVVVIEVHGEVDAYSSGALRNRLTLVIDSRRVRLVVDLRGVTFLDSTGLSALIGAARQARRHAGEVHLVVDQERVINLFRASALTRFFPMHATVEAALAAASSGEVAEGGSQGVPDDDDPAGPRDSGAPAAPVTGPPAGG